ncbi:MAG: YaaL family protein [bacterium]
MPLAYENIKALLQKAAAVADSMLEYLPSSKPVQTDLVDQVEQARREWQLARRFFESVTDPDLIDYAIYNLQATEQRYTYLLKQARLEGCENREVM